MESINSDLGYAAYPLMTLPDAAFIDASNAVASMPVSALDDVDAYVNFLMQTPAMPLPMTQLQLDWDRFVTFGECVTPLPVLEEGPSDFFAAHMQLPSPSSRSVTPSPIMAALTPPVHIAPRMQRHTSGSPQVVSPTTYPPPITIIEADKERAKRHEVRKRTRKHVRTQQLHKTAEGREIVKLLTHQWYRAPSGFAVTQYGRDQSYWKCNDVANYLNWLNRGIRVHRSQVCRVLAVENIEALNAVLRDEGYPAIHVEEPPRDFFISMLGMGERQRDIPVFLRLGYRKSTVRSRDKLHAKRVADSQGDAHASAAES